MILSLRQQNFRGKSGLESKKADRLESEFLGVMNDFRCMTEVIHRSGEQTAPAEMR